jgi:hypothetical protein
LLAKSFHDSYRYRQQQEQRAVETASLSARCSVCDTIARQQQQQPQNNRIRTPLFRSHSHDHNYNDDIEHNRQQMHSDYERVSFNAPIMARAFVRSYEGNSRNSSSRRSIDNDTTLADEESIKPVEYYRG